MIKKARELVYEILRGENSGHGMDHIERVCILTQKFANKQKCNKDRAMLIALLHDVDDYKLFGADASKKLPNANKILDEIGVTAAEKEIILGELGSIGFSKRLEGKAPSTTEGKMVSDADMCEAIGITGILRSYKYNVKHGGSFFDRDVWPKEYKTAQEYRDSKVTTSVCHAFEKLLKLKNLMLTKPGKKEAKRRHNAMAQLLYQFFDEQNAPEWKNYLKDFLKKSH